MTPNALSHGSSGHNKIVSLIWGIADELLRDLFRRGKYPEFLQFVEGTSTMFAGFQFGLLVLGQQYRGEAEPREDVTRLFIKGVSDWIGITPSKAYALVKTKRSR